MKDAFHAVGDACVHLFVDSVTFPSCSLRRTSDGPTRPSMPQLLNPLATAEQVRSTPSSQDGVPASLEEELRVWGCQTIQQAGVLLHLPQVTMATAQVLFQRFWFVSSFAQFSMRSIAMGALFLACKLEETPKRVRDLINVFDFLVRRARHAAKHSPGLRARQLRLARGGEESLSLDKSNGHHVDTEFVYRPMAYFASEFYDVKDDLVVAEMQILKRLGFQVQVNLPYAIMVNYLQSLGLTSTEPKDEEDVEQSSIAQRAWALLNDALQTSVYVLFPPHVLAASSIYLASIVMKHFPPLPLEPTPWWELFDVTRDELRTVSSHILRLYDVEGSERWARKSAEDDVDDAADCSIGLAARVREESGGLVDFGSRSAVRDWLKRYAHHRPTNSSPMPG